MKQIICTSKAPEAIGSYSKAVKVEGLIYASCQLGLNPLTGKIPPGVEALAQASNKNGTASLETEWLVFSNGFKSLVFLKNMEDYSNFKELQSFFPDDFPD
jgi:2-iminobutanoate/2-iminopropanoate deaminase